MAFRLWSFGGNIPSLISTAPRGGRPKTEQVPAAGGDSPSESRQSSGRHSALTDADSSREGDVETDRQACEVETARHDGCRRTYGRHTTTAAGRMFISFFISSTLFSPRRGKSAVNSAVAIRKNNAVSPNHPLRLHCHKYTEEISWPSSSR